MKANYWNDQHDIQVIRPLIYAREKTMKQFAYESRLPVVNENCPACFEQPKERERIKKLLRHEETMCPGMYDSLRRALLPLMEDSYYQSAKKIRANIESNK